ncbi:nad dependent epimerase dehydratase family protein [Moniliophthora roreri]|nr:nad dependent epimerase dehydratase family protein [Moniliophthora roreri]
MIQRSSIITQSEVSIRSPERYLQPFDRSWLLVIIEGEGTKAIGGSKELQLANVCHMYGERKGRRGGNTKANNETRDLLDVALL